MGEILHHAYPRTSTIGELLPEIPQMPMSKILVMAEHLDGKLNPSTARVTSTTSAVKPETIDVVMLSNAPNAITPRLQAPVARVNNVQTQSPFTMKWSDKTKRGWGLL